MELCVNGPLNHGAASYTFLYKSTLELSGQPNWWLPADLSGTSIANVHDWALAYPAQKKGSRKRKMAKVVVFILDFEFRVSRFVGFCI
jgi:hypothetical protein